MGNEVTGIDSIAGITAQLAAVEQACATLAAAQQANSVVAGAVAPPGSDPSSAMAASRQVARSQEFDENMKESLTQLRSWAGTLEKTLAETVATDQEGADRIAAAMAKTAETDQAHPVPMDEKHSYHDSKHSLINQQPVGDPEHPVTRDPKWYVDQLPPLFGPEGYQISHDDINQDSYGDCFLESVLAAAADNNPERLRSMIQEIPEKPGFYRVTLFDGKQVIVTPEDVQNILDFNYHRLQDLPRASWGFIVEAAYMEQKAEENPDANTIEKYENKINGGYPGDVIRSIGGDSREIFRRHHFWEIWQNDDNENNIELNKALDNHEIVIMGTVNYGKGTNDRFISSTDGNNVHGSHAYQLISINDGIATMRNPWGSNSPHGSGPIVRVSLHELWDHHVTFAAGKF